MEYGTYYGNRIIGKPHHVEVWYDSGYHIWWVQVMDKSGGTLDIESKTGIRKSFSIDTPRRSIATDEARIVSRALGGIPIKFFRRDGKVAR